MLLRPPGDRRLAPSQRTMLLAIAVLLIPLIQLVDAQQQQQQAPGHRSFAEPPNFANIIKDGTINVDPSSSESRGLPRARQEVPLDAQDRAAPKLSFTKPKNQARRPESGSSMFATRRNPNDTPSINDASALATLAPGKPVRAPNSPRPISSILARSSSLQSARSLENWEVEDYILLATVDGHLYSVDRESGDERWHLQVEQPVVETIHYRPNTSSLRDRHDDDYHPLDDYIWAIEPTSDGAIYVWTPSHHGAGLMSTGYTMKQFVNELDHYASSDPPVVFSGYKKSTPIILDAATGRVLRWYGPAGSQVDQSQSDTCFPPNSRLVDAQREECAHGGTISLSRAEYIVEIHDRHTARNIATLKYAEWEPNKSDNDLRQQYRSPPDSRYFTSQHNGRVYAIAEPASTTTFALEFPVPVARTFDVARPLDAPKGSDPELVLLPQPIPPNRNDEESTWARTHSVFLNQTESGGWYAMSGRSYPLIVHGPRAPASRRNPWEGEVPLDDAHLSVALVGVHILGEGIDLPDWPLTMPATLPSEAYQGLEQEAAMSGDPVPTILPEFESDLRPIVETVITLPRYALDWTRDLLTNPILLCVVMFLAYRYAKLLRASLYSYWMRLRGKPIMVEPDSLSPMSSSEDSEVTVELTLAAPDAEEAKPRDLANDQTLATDKIATSQGPEPVDVLLEPVAKSEDLANAVNAEQEAQMVEPQELPEKKKKNHRGRRGGVKHRKGAKKQRDAADDSPEHPPSEPEGKIPGIQSVGSMPPLQPNIATDPVASQDVTQSIVNINDIEVNQNRQLGTGSNGTIVYAGTFHGRNVAVKRMLSQFWDVAYQETRLLVDCDEHTNVIKYYSMARNQNFLYIALELCEASLSDLIGSPDKFPDLARAGEMDMPRGLLQIANGLCFLHELRIVHRDLKPQNILVKMGRDGRPRLVVSDFGLCKKLEGGQSSFGATTAHAAGTSGWRAPELLLDDDAREANGQSMHSTHSDSSSQLAGADVVPGRRATRAIDIFSLGLVFYYVLTKGLHPFDCGDRYMREVNIRKGQFNLKPLDVLGDAAYEAKALIQTMLQANPRARPSAKDVMAHPFFWSARERLTFLCDVSDHFELEPRDPMSPALATLEQHAPQVCRGDFLKVLPKDFVDSLGKQRKYTGTRFLDLLRALRNKRSHYGDLSEALKRTVGPMPEGYLGFWTQRFPNLIIVCCTVIYKLNLEGTATFQEYFKAKLP